MKLRVQGYGFRVRGPPASLEASRPVQKNSVLLKTVPFAGHPRYHVFIMWVEIVIRISLLVLML